MKNRHPMSSFLLGKGMYVALAVCLAAAGTAAWVTINNSLSTDPFEPAPQLEQPQENIEEPLSSLEVPESPAEAENTPVEQKQSNISKDSSTENVPSGKPSVSSSSSSSSRDTAASASVSEPSPPVEQSQKLSFTLPMNSAVLAPFSGDKLVENTTLKEWRTHNGLDLKAEKGDTVKAACDGKISAISFDPLWGTTVEVITHQNGKDYILTYCGLNEELPIKLNDSISMGDKLGTIDSIPCEAAVGPHLHFTVQENNKYIDPFSLLSE